MSITAVQLRQLVESELASLSDQRVFDHIQRLLIDPRIELRDWDYGEPGQQFPCWIFLDDSVESGTCVAYCEFGFGPSFPWGLLKSRDVDGDTPGYYGMGMDSGWFSRMLDAVFDSFIVTRLPIWRIFEGVLHANPKPISDEGPWDSTWEQAYELRRKFPNNIYNPHHGITY